ncbi:Uncharacterized protein SCF082_LOCUS7136, partial [Durusdinium trenchii]
QGYEKMKELEELMNGTGFFNEAHSLGLGDVLELSDSEGGDDNNNEDENSKAKPGKGQLPSIEGQEKCAEFVSKYKKAILARCRTFKDTSDRWNAEAPTSGREAYAAVEKTNGDCEMSALYKELCAKESEQLKVNPENKGAYKDLAHNAELAAKHAARQANTMIPGISGFVEVQQLAIPNDLKTNKEEAFIQQVLRIGEFMNVPLTELFLHTIGKKNHCLEIRAVAERIFADYPTKFLAGFSVCERAQFQQTLAKFWDAFQRYYPNHPVLTMAISFVHAQLKFTGKGLMQATWGCGNIPDKLAAAYTAFAAFCKDLGENPMVKHFTRDNLSWTSLNKYPEASFKGSDTRLILGFLVDVLANRSAEMDALEM